MVRETRHLWVGNLPDNIREDRIREHFKRYGRVQNVKLLGRTENASALAGGSAISGCGICATVAFMDIKSASKAHNAEHVLEDRTLTTEYYEPAAIPTAAGVPSAGSSPAGSGYSGSSSSVNSAPNPASTSRYHLSGGEDSTSNPCAMAATAAAPANWRGTNDSATEYCRRGNTPLTYGRYQRHNSTAPYDTPPPSNTERTTPHHRWYASGASGAGGTATGGESTPSTPGGATESGRRRRPSGSGSSRSESSSPEPSDTSRASTPAAPPPHPHNNHTNHRTPPTHQHQWASTASGRPLAICVRNLPTRSTDSSLKDGLYHEYKKHGKVVWVKVVGQNADRYAVVRFKKPSDVEKALEVSQDKLFFGCKISVAPHQSCDEDADSAKPYETDIDEYHPKATRTLFIGNLEKDVTQQQLRDKFKHFGRIIEIDIKKGSGGGAGYAFCQYASISSVVEAIRAMDGEYVGGSRVKLGFGKPVATTCVWVDGLTEHTEKQVLGAVSRCGAATSVCVDRAAGAALVHFEQAAAAGAAVRELRRVAAQASAAEPDHPRLCVDYASRECQEAFYEQLEKHGGSAALSGSERLSGDLATRYPASTRHDPLRYEGCAPRPRASSYGRGSSRTPRYSAVVEHYDAAEYAADRRYRVYEEVGSSPQAEDAPYEDRLQSVVVSPHRARKHRRDSSPEDRKHSKERHRSAGGTIRRSRSGSRSGVGVPGSELRHAARRRHRRRRDGSESRGSRAGTPLRDELDALPAEPRRPPRERPPLPMSLPLPKFAAQLLRTAPATPRPAPAPALAPASPPRPPSASSSSAGSAPHSPSLEERIRSLDEKYEKWSGSRALADAPDRARLRHRLLDVDINEVKPSEVVRSLLAKRSVFDEDSERLEGAARAPSPSSAGSPRRLRYPFPAHSDTDAPDRPADPRLNRPERPYLPERLGKFNESDYRVDSRLRLRTPSTDKVQPEPTDRKPSPKTDPARTAELDSESWKDVDRRKRDFLFCGKETERKLSFDLDPMDVKEGLEKIVFDYQNKIDKSISSDTRRSTENSEPVTDRLTINKKSDPIDELKIKRSDSSNSTEICNMPEVADKKIILPEELQEKKSNQNDKIIEKFEFKIKTESLIEKEIRTSLENESKEEEMFQIKSEFDIKTELPVSNHIKKEIIDFEVPQNHLNNMNSIKPSKDLSDLSQELIRSTEKNGKERLNQNILLELEALQNSKKIEKENIEFVKSFDKDKSGSHSLFATEVTKVTDVEKTGDERIKTEREKAGVKNRSEKEKHEHEREKPKNNRNERALEKHEKDKKSKVDTCTDKAHADKGEKIKTEKDIDKNSRDKTERDVDRAKNHDEKSSRHDHHKRDKHEKDRRKECVEIDFLSKTKKDDKCKYDRPKKESESKRDAKKETDSTKMRKSSRDESIRDLCRKDSTDSSTSRASQDSSKVKEPDNIDSKDDVKNKAKLQNDLISKHKSEKEMSMKFIDPFKLNPTVKLKMTDIKEEKVSSDCVSVKVSVDNSLENTFKSKPEITEKQRHYSLDSPSFDSKRKERLNSCSSLPAHIGHKRRMSSQDTFDFLNEESKKSKTDSKDPERRDSKDSRSGDRHKTTKFNKGYFAKIIESKTKDDKKNQVKPPDDEWKDTNDTKDLKQEKSKSLRKSPKGDSEEKLDSNSDIQTDGLHNDFDFLATLELRSSEEDERQRALRKEMKEKKRIQQLQQIQELQMKQQDVLQQGGDLTCKNKDEKKLKMDDKRKEVAREKRMSTDRKSREDKNDNQKRKNRKMTQSTDTSDSDEPKKHSIFDIVDDGPTYISMYDKVKARSCKNMQKQEEEKRQEKIKAKFSQLKQSRAKREEKKRSSWDEDSDSDQDGGRRRQPKMSMDSSSDDENVLLQSKKREKSQSLDFDRKQISDFLNLPSTEEDTQNKLSRKNSRSRIMSDTSDDENSKRRSASKSPTFLNKVKKELMSDLELLQDRQDDIIPSSDAPCDKVNKNSLLNLFGKSDSDDSKLKSSLGMDNDYKPCFAPNCNDFSSESESMAAHRHTGEARKKHKKRQKKHKFSFSEDETKGENADCNSVGGTSKHRHSDKIRRHSNKKEKRKDKIRDSFDGDDSRDEKNKAKRNKNLLNNFSELVSEPNCNNAKMEGKMEDIFGPLSDDSDKESKGMIQKQNSLLHDYNGTLSASNDISIKTTSDDGRQREKDELKRRRERKRKEKRYFSKEDENSLDVDAVSRAIEARLFADSITDEDNRIRAESPLGSITKDEQNDLNYIGEDQALDTNVAEGLSENLKRECREKKKKKKRNKEDRQSRKEHHLFHNHSKLDKPDLLINSTMTLSPKTLSEIPMPSDTESTSVTNKSDDCASLSETQSLPRLSDSPFIVIQPDDNNDTKSSSSDITSCVISTDAMKLLSEEYPTIEIDKIPMPAPIETIVQDISDIPMPEEPEPVKRNSKSGNFSPSFTIDVDPSEDAVRSISNLEKEPDKNIDKIDTPTTPVDEKTEKPRAVISQEETEDAVAALLGESFGGKKISFTNCYEETESSSTHEVEIESSNLENSLEQDPEEMRRAVINLNISEMETKPETPVSDSDLLLIDTDNEETEDAPQDAIERLPVNIIATNQSLGVKTAIAISNIVTSATTNIIVAKPKQTVPVSDSSETKTKVSESDSKLPLVKREPVHQITSTATPVITSWTLTNNKLLEPHILNIQPNKVALRDVNENKPRHITANIVQIKTPQSQSLQIGNAVRPILSPNRMSAPYQVINHIRPQTNMQPPTIKIPEPHILYQKPQGIVISPRLSTDPRLQSPKANPQGRDGMTSPRLAILSTSPQNLNVGMVSPNTIQQRSPGQVTVVRMQQPPLSPIQGMHIQHGVRTMMSPNRPSSVLVQTQGAPIHFNRLPVTPVLAPISKQMSVNNIIPHSKSIGINPPTLVHQHKIITSECGKVDQRPGTDHEAAKIILSSTNLHQNTNPTVMAQNRLISMQNAMHVGTISSPLHLANKSIISHVNHISEKRENQVQKVEQHNHIPYGAAPILHVSAVNHTSASIIQNPCKSVMSAIQETNLNRGPGSNVIHTLNTSRVLTSAPMSNIIQIDSSKPPPSVLSIATIRPSTVVTKLDSTSTGITTSTLTNVVMTPLLLKTSQAPITPKINIKNEASNEINPSTITQNQFTRVKTEGLTVNDDNETTAKLPTDVSETQLVHTSKDNPTCANPVIPSSEHITKCETDFEELLKDNTNEIKITNDTEKKLEVNVGKSVTLFAASHTRLDNIDFIKEMQRPDVLTPESTTSEGSVTSQKDIRINNDVMDKELTNNSNSELSTTEKNTKELNKEPCDEDKNSNTGNILNIFNTPENSPNFTTAKGIDMIDNKFPSLLLQGPIDSQVKNIDENDSWSAKDVNIESVIKKVDSLCNENIEDIKDDIKTESDVQSNTGENDSNTSEEAIVSMESVKPTQTESVIENKLDGIGVEKNTPSKRGGRSMRGKKSEKNQDRVQTRQISKSPRGGSAAKRGRGRAKVDKKIKNALNTISNTLPGDVYDFHEDSGDETSTSPNKSETRPRLILTIKSPLGHSNAIATSTLSIGQKEALKNTEKPISKDDKLEDFVSPSPNTRKSRRLQEKDVQRSTVDDVIDDVIKGSATSTKSGKEINKKRPTRQSGAKTTPQDKASDTRKSPRGTKRSRDRSLSDASIDSSDEKIVKKEESVRDAKVPKLAETPVTAKMEVDTPVLKPVVTSTHNSPPVTLNAPALVSQPLVSSPTVVNHLSMAGTSQPAVQSTIVSNKTPIISSTTVTINPPVSNTVVVSNSAVSNHLSVVNNTVVSNPHPAPTPIMKPPKKMISEISAKLAFESAATATVAPSTEYQADKAPAEANKQHVLPVREPRSQEPEMVPATGEAGEALARRLADGVPGHMVPVGATEATDERVQSPALPHRPLVSHRPADRATPILMRAGEGEGAGASRGVRAGYAGTASLPRGAHHPPPPHALHAPLGQLAPHAPLAPLAPLVPLAPMNHAKPVPPVQPHHHPGAASRGTITCVPKISPQGQVALSDGMYPHFSPQHYQMYQQHFRATQENRATPSQFTRTLEAEGSEAPAPPLELRRVPTARVPRPAHSPSPADRHIMYAVGCGRSPPPAHGTSRLPGALPPLAAPGPPHASQVPREADSLQMLLRRYPVMWQGLLALKNDSAAVQMHFVGGSMRVAHDTLPRHTDGSTPPLRIAQRMRLEPVQLDQVHRKMKLENEHCILLALPCGRDHMDVLQQSTNLNGGFITYLQRKQAAGIVNVALPGHHQAMYTVHIFPSCDFANENLNRIAPDLMHRVADIAHLLIVIATV
ncbi:spen family transcriptional repressor split ends isoform X2 [Choristoneura fumiferana]|uniref:spen family transcriptional repressor split ends isoform X2 n=1 Tax=Choristoneura fumiferana TaxID=7141 RepID=UPI003D15BD68